MSDIPYSVRDKNVRVNAIKGFNFADIDTNEMFKKVDDNNVGGTDVFSQQTSTTNKLSIQTGTGAFSQTVGTIEGVTDLLTRTLHMNTFGDRNRGISIFDNGTSSRVGIGITEPEEDLEVAGNIQIDSANVARLKFQKSGNPATAHALGEIDGEQDLTDGGDLQFYTKVNGGNVTEKLRINNIGAIGIGGATYGDVGAVLTSNGNAASVSWNRPYFMKARVNTNYAITNNNNPILMTEDNLGNNNYNFGDFSVNAWTCPQTGIYRVKTCITAKSTSLDALRHLSNITKLQTNAGVDIRNIADTVCLPGGEPESELEEVSVPAESIEHINQNELVKLFTFFVVGTGAGITIGGRTDSAKTYMIIERII
jgi:hypothetical protein